MPPKDARPVPVRRETAPGNLFDERPITLDGFVLKVNGIQPVGRPSIEKWIMAMDFATATEQASPFWVGDLWNYAQEREEWKDAVYQALTRLGRPVTIKTLQNLGYVSKRVDPRAKALAPSLAHADVVASLEPAEQVEWMQTANHGALSVRELRLEIRTARRQKVIEGQAVLSGQYRVIYADPPWLYADSAPTKDGSLGKAARHFPGMTIEQLCKLPVAAHALPDSTLFLWVTATMLYENPGPREVIEAWGFTPKTGRVWDKVLGMPGHYGTHVVHEHLIIATRGRGTPIVSTPQEKSILVERRPDEHSGKPESLRRWIVQHWTEGPYLELFGRRAVEGWDVLGNDSRLWASELERAGSRTIVGTL